MRRGFADGQLTGAINDVDEVSGHDTGRALTFPVERPDLLERVAWGAGPEPSTKHFRTCETRGVDTGAHLSDKFRRDRFEASKDPHAPARLAQRGPEGTVTGYEVKPATGGFP